jgi:hypothetical protein
MYFIPAIAKMREELYLFYQTFAKIINNPKQYGYKTQPNVGKK